jgi:hypothetical protein
VFRAALTTAAFAILGAALSAQTPAPAPTTGVLTTLTIKPEIERPQVMKVMPDEVRETMKMYLDGKIQQWWARADGKGVVFVLNARTVAEAKALTDTLPLSKANLASFEYTALTPADAAADAADRAGEIAGRCPGRVGRPAMRGDRIGCGARRDNPSESGYTPLMKMMSRRLIAALLILMPARAASAQTVADVLEKMVAALGGAPRLAS